MAVTAVDVARLAAASALPASALVTWLAPDQVDMTGEPESFVELGEGRRLMVLAQRDGACQLLGSDQRCRAYDARPRDCRTFPFTFGAAEAGPPVPRRLTLLPLSDCEYESDGHNDPSALDAEDKTRWSELRDYQALVARWNRRAWHRRRMQHAVGDAAAFLAYAFAAQPSATR